MAPISKHPPAALPFAVLSDVHGNLEALEAVLAELERRGVRDIYAAGDHLNDGAAPLATWRRMMAASVRCVRGVGDTALSRIDPSTLSAETEADREKLERFVATRHALGELVLSTLGKLPLSLRVPLIDGTELLVVHGSPADPFQELSADMSDDEMLALVDVDPASVIACGASHIPFQRELPEVRVLSVGSVGMAPEGRVAHYAVLTPLPSGTMIEQAWVEY